MRDATLTSRVTLRSLLGAALVACLAAGCSAPSVTALDVTVHYDTSWPLSEATVKLDTVSGSAQVGSAARVLVADDWAGRTLSLEVWGLAGVEKWAHGAATVTPVLGQIIPVEITLSRLPCGAWCTTGATECQGDLVATCGQHDSDQCLEWSNAVPCPAATPYCSLGVCSKTCVDECEKGEVRCDGPGAVKTCGEHDSDTCADWMPSVKCAAGETCSNGACAKTCKDECAAGSTSCLGAGVVTCGDLDGDGCLEWGPIVPCAAGLSCSAGTCQLGCTDECTTSMCSGTSLKACGQYDLDPCKDLSPGVSCVPSDPCTDGACVAGACQTAPLVCEAPPASTCVSASTLRVYDAIGMCSATGCGYGYKDIACPSCPSCDPCAGVSCNGPAPSPTCLDATTLRTFSAPGSCALGTCSYPFTDKACANGCASGACKPGGVTPKGETVSAGEYYTCGVKADGTLACWGDNTTGQATPPSGTFSAVGAGGSDTNCHTCAVKTDGTLACWGYNSDGQATPPAGTFRTVSAGGVHTCGIKTDGTVACWGRNSQGRASPPAGTFVSVSAGQYHSCGVETDGSVSCWGSDTYHQATPPTGTYASISAGAIHTCGVKTDGTVACWGDNTTGQSSPPSGTFSSVSAGGSHTCGVKTDGTVACWGGNDFGQSTPPAGTFSSVSAGEIHACGVKTNGTVACWGGNGDGESTPPSGTFKQ